MGHIKDEVLIKIVAETLKEIRNNKKLTQEEVYNWGIGGLGHLGIGGFESYQSNIRISTLNFLCNYYGITISDFFNIIEKKSTQ